MRQLLFLAALLLTAAGQKAGSPPAVDPAFDRYAAPAKLVSLPGNRTINLDCRGSGKPTVLLIPGLTAWSEVWVKVHDRLAASYRVCAFDPAGFGFSSGSPDPQDALRIVGDLEAALKAAGISEPYIMVGHSAGGLQALTFADRHRREVFGMVLVDPSYPGIFADFDRVAPNLSRFFYGMNERQTTAYARCADALAAGIKPSAEDASVCFVYRPEFSEKVRSALSAIETPERMRTKISQVQNFAAGSRKTANSSRNYGAMPLIVLTRGNMGPPPGGPPPGMPPEANAEGAASDRAWVAAHAALAKLSSRGEQRIVANAGHMVQFDQPGAVASAVVDVAKAAQ